MDISISQEEMIYDCGAKIRVIGVGGGGGNAVQSMIDAGLSGVDFIVANTDMQALVKSGAGTKIQLGASLTRGLGAGARPEVGKAAAEESIEEIREAIGDADMVFITAGMGGGTGTGAAPVIAKTAKDNKVLTVGVVTKPFNFEGNRRMRTAEAGLLELADHVDSLIVVPNTRLLSSGMKNAKMLEMLTKADEVLCSAVRGITDLIKSPGHINADFADIRTVMNDKGMALMGAASASGEDRAITAAKAAISSPFLEDLSIQTAKGIIVNVTATEDITMEEYSDAISYITDCLDEETIVVSAMAIDESAQDNLTVTVIATGLSQQVEMMSNSPSNTGSTPSQQFQNNNIPTNNIPFQQQNQAVRQQQQYNNNHYNNQPNQHMMQQQSTLASLHTNSGQQMNLSDTNSPTFLRRAKSRPHNPGGQDFVYTDDEMEYPTFIRKQVN